jgi:AbrB family looped-hinge helix DNA binding protein
MLMKVFNKGQVVIPAEIRRGLGISVGDMLDVVLDAKHRSVQLRPRGSSKARSLAGSLSAYSKQKKMPTKRQMAEALVKGLAR